ncbi:MAG: 50S ribosomal protein L32 [Actinobacteria bacterium]|nr:50S ribosomal protein L32 [Actinomycetota bacterium]
MAVPKGKTTRMKRDKRRTHDVLKKVSIVQCTRCHSMKIAHRVCQECGYYNNIEIIPVEEKSRSREKAKEKTGK